MKRVRRQAPHEAAESESDLCDLEGSIEIAG